MIKITKVNVCLLLIIFLITGCSNKKENIDLSEITSFQLIELTDTNINYIEKNNLLVLAENGYESKQVFEYTNKDEIEMLNLFIKSLTLSKSDDVFPVGGKRIFELKLSTQNINEHYFIMYTGEYITTIFYQINTVTSEVNKFYINTDILDKTLNELLSN